MFRGPDNNYLKSNAITAVNFIPGTRPRSLARELLNVHTTGARQKLSQQLAEALNATAQLPSCTVKISDTRQYHRRSGGRVVFRQYGYYRSRSRYLYLQNRTSVRGQYVAPKSFLETLLHEWLHHYDTYALGLNSIHTRGFYLRLRSLKERLGLL